MPTSKAAHVPSRAPILLVVTLASGCVIPIAPQFDDPEVNYPPYVESSSPSVGENITLGMTAEGREIRTTLSDRNINDDLYIRWMVDYPGTGVNPALLVRQVQLPISGMVVRPPVRITLTCRDLGVERGLHRFTMSVSDRPYLERLAGQDVDPEAPFDSVDVSQANRIRLIWILNCP